MAPAVPLGGPCAHSCQAFTVYDRDTEYLTIKYDQDGNRQWMARYNGFVGPINCTDTPHDMTVDKAGNVFITGDSHRQESFYDMITMKYDTNGPSACFVSTALFTR